MKIPGATPHQDQVRLLTVNIHDANIPSIDGVSLTPLFLDRENGVWVLYGKFAPGTVLPTHFHTGTVHFYTTKGRWNYKEYPDDPQTAGSYLYEPAGSVHTFVVPSDATEDAEGFMVVSGANVNFVDGQYADIQDAGWFEEMFLAFEKTSGVPFNFILPGLAHIRSKAASVI